MDESELPVVVIGAGPAGLAAAANLLDRGLVPLVLEAGPSADTSVRGWRWRAGCHGPHRVPGTRLDFDPNVHSCGTVYPHGARELAQPEPGVFLVGMKSYGRAPTFLALTGYEQIRSVAAALAGDWQAAERVELVLPETGVCSGGGLVDESMTVPAGGGCCGPTEPDLGGAAPIGPDAH